MSNAVLITGQTYPHRRALRAAGALFDRGEMGYIIAADAFPDIKDFISEHDLDATRYEATEEQLTPATGERLRKIRQERQDRRAERLRERADAADRRAEKAHNKISEGERSFLRLGEPVKVGHHSEGRHRRLISRFEKATTEEFEERAKAQRLRERADFMQPARIRGDAEKQRQRKRDFADLQISAGDLVDTTHFGAGIVERVNKNTYTVRLTERGGQVFTHEKSFCHLIEKREPVKRTPKFKKGDLVMVRHHHTHWYPGKVLRRTRNGYSVEFEWTFGDRAYTHKKTATEGDLKPLDDDAETGGSND